MSSKSSLKVNFFWAGGVSPFLRNRNELKLFLNFLFNNEKKDAEKINYIFTSDKELLVINKTYLKHNFFTDIITFELNSPGKPIEADIYISLERVRENAQQLGISINNELHRVIFHGALHLCGYSDKNRLNKKIMRSREDFYLKKYFG